MEQNSRSAKRQRLRSRSKARGLSFTTEEQSNQLKDMSLARDNRGQNKLDALSTLNKGVDYFTRLPLLLKRFTWETQQSQVHSPLSIASTQIAARTSHCDCILVGGLWL